MLQSPFVIGPVKFDVGDRGEPRGAVAIETDAATDAAVKAAGSVDDIRGRGVVGHRSLLTQRLMASGGGSIAAARRCAPTMALVDAVVYDGEVCPGCREMPRLRCASTHLGCRDADTPQRETARAQWLLALELGGLGRANGAGLSGAPSCRDDRQSGQNESDHEGDDGQQERQVSREVEYESNLVHLIAVMEFSLVGAKEDDDR
jgi:hypothetical protein